MRKIRLICNNYRDESRHKRMKLLFIPSRLLNPPNKTAQSKFMTCELLKMLDLLLLY